MKNIFRSPINIVIGWWAFWGYISIFSFTGLYVPSAKTYLILATFILSLFIGKKLSSLAEKKINIRYLDKSSEDVFNLLFKSFTIINGASLVALIIRSIYLIKNSLTPTVYRATAFSTETTIGTLFNNRLVENCYFFISSPMLFFLALYGLVDFWKNGKFRKLFIAFILNAMDAYMRLGRVNLYLMIVLFLIVFLISDYKFVAFLRHKKKQITLIFAVFICILYIGVQRGYSPTQQFKMFIVDYHTVGFDLFDHELTDKASALHTQTTYGRLTLGGLETILTVVIRRFDDLYYSPALANSIRMANKSIVVGVESPPTVIFNGVKVYNSFYTLLYTFYSDGGYVGIILGGIVLGFLVSYFHSRWKKFNCTLDAFFLILFISIAILSIFMSQLEIMRTWIMIIFLLMLSYTTKLKNEN